MSDGAYGGVVGGRLKMKRASKKSKKKKKKKRKREADAEATSLALVGDDAPSSAVDDEERAAEAGGAEGGAAAPAADLDMRTASERRHDAVMKKRRMEVVGKMTERTHREKVEDFNNYLAALTEHHDMLKVGGGV